MPAFSGGGNNGADAASWTTRDTMSIRKARVILKKLIIGISAIAAIAASGTACQGRSKTGPGLPVENWSTLEPGSAAVERSP